MNINYSVDSGSDSDINSFIDLVSNLFSGDSFLYLWGDAVDINSKANRPPIRCRRLSVLDGSHIKNPAKISWEDAMQAVDVKMNLNIMLILCVLLM